jgi:N-acetylated-alpha-linked acidic dipeptidase
MRRLAAVSLLTLLPVSAAAQQTTQPLLGFTPQSETVERTWESKFQAIPDPKRISENMHLLAAHPHNVGSAAQRANAEWLVKQYRSWGWDAKIEQFDVPYPTPKMRVLESGLC